MDIARSSAHFEQIINDIVCFCCLIEIVFNLARVEGIEPPVSSFGDCYVTVTPHPRVVTPLRFERRTPTLKVWCSNQLSYEVILT